MVPRLTLSHTKVAVVFLSVYAYFAIPARGCSSVGRALRSQRRGRRFDPDQLHEGRSSEPEAHPPMAENLLSSTIAERFCVGLSAVFLAEGASAFGGDPDQLHKMVVGYFRQTA